PDDLQIREIRRSSGGLGAAWVQCPLAPAQKQLAAGGLVVGWARASIRVLEDRPIQCFKCLRYVHMAVTCQTDNGLAGRCFRCGRAGHVAKGFTEVVRCPLCQYEGKKADHRMGGPACKTVPRAASKRGAPTSKSKRR
ncbi:hypothetical protein EAI_07178, partial [Harpegnathos saltator]